MTTRFVLTECCDSPVVLSDPDTQALVADVICTRCRTVVGTPGVEDGPAVARFVQWATSLSWRLSPIQRDPMSFVRMTGC